MLDRLSPAATQDIGLLISILHTSEEGVWRDGRRDASAEGTADDRAETAAT